MSYKLAASSWGQEELDAIQRVIESEQFSMGSEVAAFEESFADWHNLKYGVMVNSGSSANLIGIASLFFRSENPLKRGDEVIVPAISWSTTYAPLQQYGLKLKFIDVKHKERQTGEVSIKKWKLFVFCLKSLKEIIQFK